MLYAKISPAAKTTKKTNMFDVEIIDLDYIAVLASPYKLGDTRDTEFNVKFGTMTLTNNLPVKFNNQGDDARVKLTSAEMADWGTDDKVIFEKIALKLKVTIIDYVELESPKHGF